MNSRHSNERKGTWKNIPKKKSKQNIFTLYKTSHNGHLKHEAYRKSAVYEFEKFEYMRCA